VAPAAQTSAQPPQNCALAGPTCPGHKPGPASNGSAEIGQSGGMSPADKLKLAGHTFLDGAGMIPVLGEVANGANALWYAGEGNYIDAAGSAAAMIPIGGEAADAVKLARDGEKIYKATHTAEDAADTGQGLAKLADGATPPEAAARGGTPAPGEPLLPGKATPGGSGAGGGGPPGAAPPGGVAGAGGKPPVSEPAGQPGVGGTGKPAVGEPAGQSTAGSGKPPAEEPGGQPAVGAAGAEKPATGEPAGQSDVAGDGAKTAVEEPAKQPALVGAGAKSPAAEPAHVGKGQPVEEPATVGGGKPPAEEAAGRPATTGPEANASGPRPAGKPAQAGPGPHPGTAEPPTGEPPAAEPVPTESAGGRIADGGAGTSPPNGPESGPAPIPNKSPEPGATTGHAEGNTPARNTSDGVPADDPGPFKQLPESTLPSGTEAQHLVQHAEPVGSALKADAYHRAAAFASEDIASKGAVYRIIGRDQIEKTLIQTPGEVNGKPGRFEWIVTDQGQLTHQTFIEGGRINGLWNKP
jgi:hypothetical protein